MSAEKGFSFGFQELCCGRRPPITYGVPPIAFPNSKMPLLENVQSSETIEEPDGRRWSSVEKPVSPQKMKVEVFDEHSSRSTMQVNKNFIKFGCSSCKKLCLDVKSWLLSRRYYFFEMYNPSVTSSEALRNNKLVALIFISSVLSILSSGFRLGLLMGSTWSEAVAVWLSQYLEDPQSVARWVLSISVLILLVDYCIRLWIVVEGRPNCYMYYCRSWTANLKERLFWLTSPRVLLDLISIVLSLTLVEGSALIDLQNISLPYIFILNTAIRIAVLVKRSPGYGRKRRIPLECLKEDSPLICPLHKAVVQLDLKKVESLLTGGTRADDFVTLNASCCHPRWRCKAHFENITPLMCAVQCLSCFSKLNKKSPVDMKREGDRIIECIGLLIDHGSNPLLQYEADNTWYSPKGFVKWGSDAAKDATLKGLYDDALARMSCRAKAIEFDLISASFLRELNEEALPRRQDIEMQWAKAKRKSKKRVKFGSAEETKVFEKVKLDLRNPLSSRKVVAISHRWEQPDQPDPSAKQMGMIKEFLKQEAFKDTEYVFYDFWCLHQPKSSLLHGGITQRRKWHEEAEFQHQLRNMYLLYSMAHVIVLIDLQYATRAWPVFEAYQATRSISPERGVTRALDDSRYTIGQLHSNEISEGVAATIVHNIAKRELMAIQDFIASEEVLVTNGKDKVDIVDQLSSQQNYVLEHMQKIV